MQRILVWDIPTRLFHWLFAASFAGAWLTSGSDARLSFHLFFGYLMLGLIGFRLVWGVVGGYYARFATFWSTPLMGLIYLRQVLGGGGARYVGHNPAGSQAIFLLLILGLTVGLSGLLVQGGEEQRGAVAGWLGYVLGNVIKEGHEVAAAIMLLVVLGHLAGVLLESWAHRENLARSMVTGMKQAPRGDPVSKPFRLVGVSLLAAVIAFGVWEGLSAMIVSPVLADNPKWREECGSCHPAFHPSLLPARSWKKMLAEQDRHFGTDLALDDATREALLAFMVGNAAERLATEAAFKINRSINPEATPLRITETPYWIGKHREIAESDWRRSPVKSRVNCAACHLDAEAGAYEDAAVRIPPKQTALSKP